MIVAARRRGPRENAFQNRRRSAVSATLRLTHKTIGVEVRRGTYDVVVDGKRADLLSLFRDGGHIEGRPSAGVIPACLR
jgi:hypothetical protein